MSNPSQYEEHITWATLRDLDASTYYTGQASVRRGPDSLQAQLKFFPYTHNNTNICSETEDHGNGSSSTSGHGAARVSRADV